MIAAMNTEYRTSFKYVGKKKHINQGNYIYEIRICNNI